MAFSAATCIISLMLTPNFHLYGHRMASSAYTPQDIMVGRGYLSAATLSFLDTLFISTLRALAFACLYGWGGMTNTSHISAVRTPVYRSLTALGAVHRIVCSAALAAAVPAALVAVAVSRVCVVQYRRFSRVHWCDRGVVARVDLQDACAVHIYA